MGTINISDRDKVLRRTYKMYVRGGIYKNDEYHKFCLMAKGKSEWLLLKNLKVGKG